MEAAGSAAELADILRGDGVTHLFLSRGDIGFVVLHNPAGQHLAALKFFLGDFRTHHTQQVYADEWVSIHELEAR